jgi:hypothetical protein
MTMNETFAARWFMGVLSANLTLCLLDVIFGPFFPSLRVSSLVGFGVGGIVGLVALAPIFGLVLLDRRGQQ